MKISNRELLSEGSRFFLFFCVLAGNITPPTEVGGVQSGARREKEKKGESTAGEESNVM